MNINDLEDFEQIGEGGMAAVWKAHQTSLDRSVAVKIFRTELTSNPEKMAVFMQEAKAAASLKNPNIIPLYDSIEHEGAYYFVMEYVNGKTVADILASGPMPWKKVMQIGLSMAQALDYALAGQKLLHRNIKPSNIILDDDGTAKLADLGLTTYMDNRYLSEQIQIRHLDFLPNYLSPEQARCKTTLESKTDMYSLGATMYHMLTGQGPFQEYEPMQVLDMHISGHLPNPRDIVPSIPVSVAQLITRLMMKDPNDRFATWNEAIKEMKKVLTGRGLAGKQGKSPESTVSPATKKAMASQSSESIAEQETVEVPIWVRAIAWSLLSLWWVYVVFIICRLPPVLPLPPVRPEPKKVAVVTPPRVITPPKPAVAQTSTNNIPSGNGKEAAGTALSPQKAIDVSNEEMILLHSLKAKLTDCIMNQNFNEAIAYIAQEKQYTHSRLFDSEVDKIEKYINEISGQGSILETTLKKKIGQSISIKANGVKRDVVLKGIDNGTIRAEIKSTIGSATTLTPVNIPIAQIDPLEQIALIGTPDTEAKCIAIFGLSLRAKDYKLAAKAAERCGPFAETFKLKIEAEIPVPQPQ